MKETTHDHVEEEEHEQSLAVRFVRLGLVLVFFVSALLLKKSAPAVPIVLFLLAYIAAGYDVILGALRKLLRGKLFDETFLMSLATVGALCLGDYAEAVAVMLLYQIGEALEDRAAERSHDAIASLTNLRPDTAHILYEGHENDIAPADIRIGDTIIVHPGERVPVDGKAVNGGITLDTSSVTGESMPAVTSPGASVYAGSIVTDGVLTFTSTSTDADSTAARILSLMEQAAEKKAPTERFITRFSRLYTPLVVLAALLIALIPPLFFQKDLLDYLHRGLIFLVVSCPCALVISVPLAYVAGMGAASADGILFKGGEVIDALAAVKTAVFDKTGTLTKGSFGIRAVIPADGVEKNELLSLAAYGEHYSDHPLAKALKAAFSKEDAAFRVPDAGDFREIAGRGTVSLLNGKELLCGNAAHLIERGVVFDDTADGTVIHVALDGIYRGAIVFDDELRDSAREAVNGLMRKGIDCVMLTGDRRESAEKIAMRLGIREFKASLLPQDKADELSRLKEKGAVLFVGDGINDAPCLALADVGFAMGGTGRDAAVEAADAVLMNDEPGAVLRALDAAGRTRKTVKENVAFILAVKVIVLVLSAFGVGNMGLAVFADVGTALLAALHAAALLRCRK